MQLGVESVPRKLSRPEIELAAGSLPEPAAGAAQAFRLETYTRDTGEVLSTLSVPLYVKGQRWGVATLGWHAERLRTQPAQRATAKLAA
jgi:methyl-accepting chemotaxis protein